MALAAQALDGDNPAHAERLRIRRGAHRGHTCGLAPGYVQANLAIMPAADAQAFQTFCQLNPKPCPMLAIGAPGDPHLQTLGADLDLRTDLPGYRVFRDGEEIDVTDDITKYWRDDLVSFPLGCSLSFEDALTQDGIVLRHFERNELVAMYVTNIDTKLLTVKEALILARVRWQIELMFKLFKSHGQIDVSRSEKPYRILCEVYAKLIAMIIEHWILLVGGWRYPEYSFQKAAKVIAKHALSIAAAFASSEAGRLVDVLLDIKRALANGGRISFRKSKPSTFQLLQQTAQPLQQMP